MRKWGLIILIIILVLSACRVTKVPSYFDRASIYFYKTTRLIMTDKEKKEFLSLKTRQERIVFINQFWEKRFPDPDDRRTMVKLYYQRVSNAIAWFSERYKPGYETDRGEIYILLGLPERIETYTNLPFMDGWDADKLSPYQMWREEETTPYGVTVQDWVYYRYNFVIRFIKRTPEDEFHYTPATVTLMPIIRDVSPFTSTKKHLPEVEVSYKNETLKVTIYYRFLFFKKEGEDYIAHITLYLKIKDKYYKINLKLTYMKGKKKQTITFKNVKEAPSEVIVKDSISGRIKFIHLKKEKK